MPDLLDLVQEANEQHQADAIDSWKRGQGQEQRASRLDCLNCEEPIPEARRVAIPGCLRCVDCQRLYEGGRA